jgi:tetratricopeptide (TPR) repeat protein
MSDGASGGTKRQNPRDFSVKICRATTGEVVGTGIVVTLDGKIITCRHVVEAAGINARSGKPIRSVWALVWESIARLWRKPAADDPTGEVLVFFTSRPPEKSPRRRARVAGCFPKHADDVALLQLIDGPAPIDASRLPVLGTAAGSLGEDFDTYGYRRLADYLGLPGEGRILNFAEAPAGAALMAEPVMVQSKHIDSGMSGAAVLDRRRNLVVGVIAETADLKGSQRLADRETGFAVDVRVLTFVPFRLPVQEGPHPLGRGPQSRADVPTALAAAAPHPGDFLNAAPPALSEWVGREELLQALDAAWDGDAQRVVGWIGFGGEGKSSLAREWLRALRAAPSRPQPVGVFWWGFQDRPDLDEFFEAAITYMGSGQIDPRKLNSASLRAQVIAAMLGAGRYLFVLDGLEVLQYQESDAYGLLRSAPLREFLELFAASDHHSLCLITSRSLISDLQPYRTYLGRDLGRLSPADGRALLRKLAVQGPDEALDRVVAAWDGHALTLSLLGGFLAELHGGDVARLAEVPPPTVDEPRYERVRRVLDWYDAHLTAAERAVLVVLSAFRVPVPEEAVAPVFGAAEGPAPGPPLNALDNVDIEEVIRRLIRCRLLRHDTATRGYTLHPLVRAYYHAGLSKAGNDAGAVHLRVARYYLARAEAVANIPFPSLADLMPAVEALHHVCRAGAYDWGAGILSHHLYRGRAEVIAHQLGAFETLLAVLPEFFPDQDVSREPLVGDLLYRYFVLHEIGLSLMNVGRLREAPPFFRRAIEFAVRIPSWENVSTAYENIAGLYGYLGAIEASVEAARSARDYAREAGDQKSERNDWAVMGWAASLGGDLENAALFFQEATALHHATDFLPHLTFLNGVFHAEHLLRVGDADKAREVAELNVLVCKAEHYAPMVSAALRVLGDVEAAEQRHDEAAEYYSQAITLARGVARRDFLISALAAAGRWRGRRGEAEAARDALGEALELALVGGYRIYEADIYVGLAWAARAANELAAARTEAERARHLSVELGYYWGRVEADEVLSACDTAVIRRG